MIDDCLFCNLIKEKKGYIINENEDFIAILDIKPISKGHTLVISKEHYKDFRDFSKEKGCSYIAFIQETINKLKKIGFEGINIGTNNGSAAGQVIFHFHTHLIPRWKNDGLSSWPSKEVNKDYFENLMKEINN